MSEADNEKKDKLLKLVRDAVQSDVSLRQQFQVGEKFRFIRDRLNALLARVEESFSEMKKEEESHIKIVAEDEVLLYVYLFNAQGLTLSTWNKMVNASVFYEYSVNRPIYQDKHDIEAIIRSKAVKAQHGYLTIAVKRDNILKVPAEEIAKDPNGVALVKVKEGSLLFPRLIAFTHLEKEYIVNESGTLIKKP